MGYVHQLRPLARRKPIILRCQASYLIRQLLCSWQHNLGPGLRSPSLSPDTMALASANSQQKDGWETSCGGIPGSWSFFRGLLS